MSWEAWGDGDDGESYEHLLDAGWLTSEDAELLADEKNHYKKWCFILCACVAFTVIVSVIFDSYRHPPLPVSPECEWSTAAVKRMEDQGHCP